MKLLNRLLHNISLSRRITFESTNRFLVIGLPIIIAVIILIVMIAIIYNKYKKEQKKKEEEAMLKQWQKELEKQEELRKQNELKEKEEENKSQLTSTTQTKQKKLAKSNYQNNNQQQKYYNNNLPKQTVGNYYGRPTGLMNVLPIQSVGTHLVNIPSSSSANNNNSKQPLQNNWTSGKLQEASGNTTALNNTSPTGAIRNRNNELNRDAIANTNANTNNNANANTNAGINTNTNNNANNIGNNTNTNTNNNPSNSIPIMKQDPQNKSPSSNPGGEKPLSGPPLPLNNTQNNDDEDFSKISPPSRPSGNEEGTQPKTGAIGSQPEAGGRDELQFKAPPSNIQDDDEDFSKISPPSRPSGNEEGNEEQEKEKKDKKTVKIYAEVLQNFALDINRMIEQLTEGLTSLGSSSNYFFINSNTNKVGTFYIKMPLNEKKYLINQLIENFGKKEMNIEIPPTLKKMHNLCAKYGPTLTIKYLLDNNLIDCYFDQKRFLTTFLKKITLFSLNIAM